MNGNLNPLKSNLGSTPDEDLLRAFLCGNEYGFDELINRYRDRVYRFVSRCLNYDMETVDEVAQHAFITVFNSGRSCQSAGSFSLHLFSATYLLLISHLRWPYKNANSNEKFACKTDTEGNHAPVEQSKRTNKHIQRLPDAHMLLLSLKIDAELPFDEIVEISGISINSANEFFASVDAFEIAGDDLKHVKAPPMFDQNVHDAVCEFMVNY